LMKDPLLRYQHLYRFEQAMLLMEEKYPFLNSQNDFVGIRHEERKIISFSRANLLFLFNFHHSNSYEDLRIPVKLPGKYVSVLDSDLVEYGGHGRIEAVDKFSEEIPCYDLPYSILVYLPCRSALVFRLEN